MVAPIHSFNPSLIKNSVCHEPTFTGIFTSYFDELYRYLVFKTGDAALARDTAQEAFTRLWKNCATVAVATARGYAFTVANNLLLNEFKHRKVVQKYVERRPDPGHAPSPEFTLEEKEFEERLNAALAALPEKQRVVFLMSRVEKRTYKEIAEALGISRQAVEKRIYKALDTLRTVVSERIR